MVEIIKETEKKRAGSVNERTGSGKYTGKLKKRHNNMNNNSMGVGE